MSSFPVYISLSTVCILYNLKYASGALINLADETIDFEILDDFDVYFTSDEWLNDESWHSSDTLYLNNLQIKKKCIAPRSCFCAFTNDGLFTKKIASFSCSLSDHYDYASHLDFEDFDSILFEMNDDDIDHLQEYEAEDDEMTAYDLRWRGRGSARKDLSLPSLKRIEFENDAGEPVAKDCPVSLASHHTIPKPTLQLFWNWLALNDRDNFLLLAGAISAQIQTYLDSNYIYDNKRQEYTDAKTDLDAALLPGNFPFRNGHGNIRIARGWRLVKGLYIWMAGNLFQGPVRGVRADDPADGYDQVRATPTQRTTDDHDGFERGSKIIHGNTKFRRLQFANKQMRKLYDASNLVWTARERTQAVRHLITYGIEADYTPFRFAEDWIWRKTIEGEWRYVIKRWTGRRLMDVYDHEYDDTELDIFDTITISFDRADWFKNSQWQTTNQFETDDGNIIRQKCSKNGNCYCKNGGEHDNKLNFIETFMCDAAVRTSSAMMDPINMVMASSSAPRYTARWGADAVSHIETTKCIVGPLGRHHIIGLAVLQGYWNAVVSNGYLRTMQPLLDKLRRLTDSASYKEWMASLYTKSGAHTHLDGGAAPPAAHGYLKNLYQWMEGNLFEGPAGEMRSDDPNKRPMGSFLHDFEDNAARIVGVEKLGAMQIIYTDMKRFIENPNRWGDRTATAKKLYTIARKLAKYCAWDNDRPVHVHPFVVDQWEIHLGEWRIKAP